jgi:quercetin dioxygenase-like cupin family protein
LTRQPIPEDGILTRQLFEDETMRAVLFTFSAGQRLSEHTASMPALLHFMEGEAVITLGRDTVEARPGTWVRMDPGLAHSIVTKAPVVMLLVLIKAVGKK